MKNIAISTLLIVSGLLALVIGSALLFDPITFEAGAGLVLQKDPSLLSEFRAVGGLLLTSGVLMIVGVFVSQLRFTAIILVALVYVTYGISRALGIYLDGVPSDSLVSAMIIELVVGLMGLGALFAHQRVEVND